MMLKMKYVVIDKCFPVLFAPSIMHKAMSVHGKVTSAGFVHVEKGRAKCYGESLSLGLAPDRDDSMLIESYLRLGGGE